jgi:glycosyltransferase involved in cell wall biosynthesis
MAGVAIVCNESPGRINAIREHSFRLAGALCGLGVPVNICLRRDDGRWYFADGESRRPPSRSLPLSLRGADDQIVLIQYNPFMYGKWGFAPWLPADLLRLKPARRRLRVALMVHEPYVPMTGWKWLLMGAWQRVQLEAARLGVDTVFASTEAWTRMLCKRRPFRPAIHLPVGSNLPDRRNRRSDTRKHLELADDETVLATLSTGHAGRLSEHVVRAANALAANGRSVALLQLGAGAPDARGLANSVRSCRPGRLADQELASWLSAADMFLAPFVDGVSTRRGSMMAALQHALPVVGTTGRLTDTLLAQA